MKIKNKGKVYPSPSSSPSSSSSSSSSVPSPNGDYLSVLKLLPAAILAIASVLSLEDREVLAYMITRSLKTTITTNPSSAARDSKKKSSKKPPSGTPHKPPIFDCDCFDCYTSYWFRWDSSPNRELIHQVIEAFEDHLTNGESEKSKKNTRAKRREKTGGRRVANKPEDILGQPQMALPEIPSPGKEESCGSAVLLPENSESSVASSEKTTDGFEENEPAIVTRELGAAAEELPVVVRTTAAVSNHKGLARKVLPDVLGLLNSRLWSLWSPNV